MNDAHFQAADAAKTSLTRAYEAYQGTSGGGTVRKALSDAFDRWKQAMIMLAANLKADGQEADARRLAPLILKVNVAVNKTLEAESTRDGYQAPANGRTGSVPFLNTMAFYDRVKELKTALEETDADFLTLRMGL